MANNNLGHLYPEFAEKITRIIALMNEYAEKNMPGYTWHLHDGFRTAKEQAKLYKIGRRGKPKEKTVTEKDGYNDKSNHQFGLGADLVPKKKIFTWKVPQKHWDYLGHCYRAEGLRWLGSTSLRDMPHGEWPPSDREMYKKASAWLKSKGLA